jgi:tetratricopeptide (TPR) repeat protein
MSIRAAVSRSSLRRIVAGLWAGAAAAGMVGCTNTTPSQDWQALLAKHSAENKPKAAGKTKFDVFGRSLGEGQEVSLATDRFMAQVTELLKTGRRGSARRFIERYPDAALETLRTTTVATEAALFVAEAYDRQCLAPNAPQTWTKLLAARRTAPDAFKPYDEARLRFQTLVSEGAVDNGLKLDLPKLASSAGAPLLELDAWLMHGAGQLLNERPTQAVKSLEKAEALATHAGGHQAAGALMLLGDARRRAGDASGAVSTWLRAVATAAQAGAGFRPMCDPVLWERLGYLRPVEAPWPQEAVQSLAAIDALPEVAVFGPGGVDPAAAEALIWNVIGRWHLERGQGQAGLVAFKRAESAVTSELPRQILRFRQAKALVQLEQSGPATAILVAQARDPNPLVSRPALAVLGSMRLKTGQTQHGFGLLKKAVETDEALEWPERGQAEADLGLAYLMMGDNRRGIDRLHQAQSRFDAYRDFDSLAMSLENEAAYLDENKRSADAAAVRERAKDLENR